MIDFQSIGFTKKTHGVKGELRLKIEDAYLEDFAQAEVVFLNIDGRKIPYFVEKVNFDNSFTIKFEEHDSRESVLLLTGKEIFLRGKDILTDSERTIEVETLVYEKYTNFEILDKTLGKLGSIEEVIEFPQQEMAVVVYQEKDLLIPLNEHLIIEIKEEERIILMDLPDGLLNLEEGE